MGTWSATIGGNDYYLDIEANIVEKCGLDLYDYLEDNSLLTRELFNVYLDEILDLSIDREEHFGPLALGALMLKAGVMIPDHLRNIILREVNTELYNWNHEDPYYDKMRIKIIKDFQTKIHNHKEGEKKELKEESLIGLSFKRDLLEPVLKELELAKAPNKIKKFVEILLIELKTPMVTICKDLKLNSNDALLGFFKNMEDLGLKLIKKSRHNEKNGAGIVLLANLFIDRIKKDQKIESVWLGRTNLDDLKNQPELGEEYGPMYMIYKLSLLGRPYIGQCNISLNKRAAQHIAMFKVAP